MHWSVAPERAGRQVSGAQREEVQKVKAARPGAHVIK